ncbi:MAG TPA: sulfatase/phosphatase domain-containing protein, partial [Sumerlaeia bacterium]|nr:sulfatase/phosphatase domain-containing protein [Sumerlaeia bacterium]
SLAPIIQGKAKGVRDTIFLAYKDLQRAVRRGRWKLLRYPQAGVTQLFDLQADPHETKNLADDPAYAGKVEEMTVRMTEQQELFGDAQPLRVEDANPAEVDLEFFQR